MATDLEAFLALYRRFGIECKVNTDEGTGNQEIVLSEDLIFRYETTRSEKFKGFGGFYTKVTFDANGKFAMQGFWE